MSLNVELSEEYTEYTFSDQWAHESEKGEIYKYSARKVRSISIPNAYWVYLTSSCHEQKKQKCRTNNITGPANTGNVAGFILLILLTSRLIVSYNYLCIIDQRHSQQLAYIQAPEGAPERTIYFVLLPTFQELSEETDLPRKRRILTGWDLMKYKASTLVTD